MDQGTHEGSLICFVRTAGPTLRRVYESLQKSEYFVRTQSPGG